ncbi:hypothetical protein EGJ53_08750 [Pseudomonas fluorescens]|nr:hypothetical protein EGJ53_08750 [Pseudomonas fluorescens]
MITPEIQKPTWMRRLFCGLHVPDVGASLLAKPVGQSTYRVPDTPSSRASSLPQDMCGES